MGDYFILCKFSSQNTILLCGISSILSLRIEKLFFAGAPNNSYDIHICKPLSFSPTIVPSSHTFIYAVLEGGVGCLRGLHLDGCWQWGIRPLLGGQMDGWQIHQGDGAGGVCAGP
jgi:hypothetical protein